tara:strand:+ start:1727 stop:2014 length:288 start_codon:yes stop_codon:yes gene_type:complete
MTLTTKHHLMFCQIEDVLADKIAPYMTMHGGTIKLLKYDEDLKNVHVELGGSCAGCSASTITLKLGVENMLKNEFPEDVKTVTHTEAEITNPFFI